MGAQDISWPALGFCMAMLTVPLAIFVLLKVKLIKVTAWSALRMCVQLLLVGLFLKYIFEWNSNPITLAWLLLMIIFAALSVTGSTGLNYRRYAPLVFTSFLVSAFLVLLYFNGMVIRLDNLLEARYAIAIAGMLLGNSLRGAIIGIGDFYKSIKRDENRYQFALASGATRYEALAPYLGGGMTMALKPALANMAAMGLVFLPGMMTGQILSGESPLLAVRYQIAIVVAIFVCVTMTVTLAVILTLVMSFDGFGVLRKDIFRKKRSTSGA